MQLPLPPFLLVGLAAVLLVLAPIFLETLAREAGWLPRGGIITAYWERLLRHPREILAALAAALVPLLLGWHYLLKLRGRVLGWFMPGQLKADQHGFPHREVDLLAEIGRRPPGTLFVGLTAQRRELLPGWNYRPLYLTDKDRAAHRHVLGRTGSGKTTSVLWPQVLQDALDGKGVVLIDAKGSDENIGTFKAIAAMAGRQQDLRVFSLPAWNEPALFTHAYNLVWVTPRAPGRRGGDPTAMAERVLSVLPLGDNVYFNTQAQLAFTNLCRLLHGMVDAQDLGYPFNLEDLAVCLRGVGGNKNEDGNTRALNHCLKHSQERGAAEALRSQFLRLGNKANECLSGLSGALERFMSPVVNAYAPDLVFEDALEANQLVYVQLPTNLFKLQAPAVAKAMLMDLQQAGSLRQVFRKQRNQRPFSVVVDEFASFADLAIIESLNKLRDANLSFTLCHQSLADLELVSKEFAQAVFDNCLTRDVLAQDNPDLCDRIAKSLGTYQRVERTNRVAAGPLFTEGMTGDASSRLVDAYRLHPNAIKSLPRCGQGYLLGAAQVSTWRGLRGVEGAQPVCYPQLPPELVDACQYELKRNDQADARGLHLYRRYVEAAAREAKGSTSASSSQAPARPAPPLRLVHHNPNGGRPRKSAQLPPDVSSDPQSQ